MNIRTRVVFLGAMITLVPLCAMEQEMCRPHGHESNEEFIKHTRKSDNYNVIPHKYLKLCPEYPEDVNFMARYGAWSRNKGILAVLQYPHANSTLREPEGKAQLIIIDTEEKKVVHNELLDEEKKYVGLAISQCGNKYITIDIEEIINEKNRREVINETFTARDVITGQKQKVALPIVKWIYAAIRPCFNKQETAAIVYRDDNIAMNPDEPIIDEHTYEIIQLAFGASDQ